jgi:hypothetical protein
MKHLVCATCGILIDCDWMGIGLSEDDICDKTDEDYHNPEEMECDCETKTITRRNERK